jgi:hypothetical protein
MWKLEETSNEWKKSNLTDIQARLSGWQLESFQELHDQQWARAAVSGHSLNTYAPVPRATVPSPQFLSGLWGHTISSVHVRNCGGSRNCGAGGHLPQPQSPEPERRIDLCHSQGCWFASQVAFMLEQMTETHSGTTMAIPFTGRPVASPHKERAKTKAEEALDF